MQKYEPERKELAPRDVVSECMMKEQAETGSDEFWLDISYKDPESSGTLPDDLQQGA